MAIYHDAYLFSPDTFANFVREHASDEINTWDKLIEQTCIFAEDSFVLALSDTYGGWDYEGIKAELAEEAEDKPYLARFIFMIYLYKYLAKFPNRIQGLGHDWLVIENSDLLNNYDKNLLIYGHPFTTFVQEYQIKQTLFGNHLGNDINPHSTGGQAGYLSHKEVSNLYESVQKVILKQASSDINTHSVFVKAKTMLEESISAKTGLCLIISG